VNALTQLVNRIAYPFLRIAMGIVLVWIGGLKFVDPSPVRVDWRLAVRSAGVEWLRVPARRW